MLTKLVEKKGRNWDTLLGPVLMAYRTTPQVSTGESPFYLLYGRDAKLSTALDFYTPKGKSLTIESEYGRELFQEMKRIRDVVKQRIKKSQKAQKDQYDKHVKESKIRTGDLVMLKVEPTFKLDRTFRGPYRVHDVTPTCPSIQPINSPNKETIFVSLQRLSRCHGTMLEDAKPWLGHGKSRKRRQVRRPGYSATEARNCGDNDTCDFNAQQMTRSGRVVRPPTRYRVNLVSCPDGSASRRGGSCKTRDGKESSGELGGQHNITQRNITLHVSITRWP